MTTPTYVLVRPGQKLDWSFDYSDWLGVDTLSSSAWTVSPTGPTLSSGSNTDTVATTFVDDTALAMVFGREYELKNSIVTTGGRKDSRSVILRCAQGP